MVSDSEKHVASLAVSRYGADGARVKAALMSVLKANAKGQSTDFLDTLVAERLLTPAQADELRVALDKTQFDLVVQPRREAGENTAPETDPDGTPTQMPALPPEAELAAGGPVVTGAELRNLGEFRILRRLGEGGMGAVYLGYQENEKRQVAIKVLNDQLSNVQASIDRFYREAKSGALLDHPNIVRNITIGQDRETRKHYLVLEYVDGPSAHALLDQYGQLGVGDAVHIILDIARALEHAHSRNIVHRDIKPDNILITRSGVAKLADMGLAKRTDEASHLTAARQGFGTPYYMPYEQAMNAKSVDGRSDIYALGATLYHLVTGEVPFAGATHLEVVEKKSLGFYPTASSINPAVPEALDRIIDKMLAREPRDRYQTASELIVDLDRSTLAAAVPSFIDPDLALQDPLVRARLTTPAQPTCPDLDSSVHKKGTPAGNGNPDLWYLRYRDKAGQWCKARATTKQLLQRLREGRMPAEVEACRQPRGKFQALKHFPELRETAGKPSLPSKPARKPKPAAKPAVARTAPRPEEAADEKARLSRTWLMGLIAAIVLAGGLVAYLVFLAS
jgi:serine/threonine-protein kinase